MSRLAFLAYFYIFLIGASSSSFVSKAADAHNTYAKLAELERQARYTEALELATKHIQTLKNALGADNPQVGHMLNRLAGLNRLKGQTTRAVEIYRNVLINFANLKGDHRRVIRTALSNLTLLYMSIGQFDIAERYAALMEREVKLAEKSDQSQMIATKPKTKAKKGEAVKKLIPSFETELVLSQITSPPKQPKRPPQVSVARLDLSGQKASIIDSKPKLAPSANISQVPIDFSNGCPKPEIATTVSNSAILNIRIISKCLAGKAYHISYGKHRFHYRLSRSGEGEQELDLFAGTQNPISITFERQKPFIISVPKLTFNNLTKIALVWHKAVDLDLHAFEYAAKPDHKGHIWSGANRTFETTYRLVSAEKRAYGYISQSSKGDRAKTNVEVYTLIRYPRQRYGAVALGLDFKSRGSKARPPFCGAHKLASVPFKVYQLQPDGNVEIASGLIPSIPCGQSIKQKARYLPLTISDIRLR